MCTVFDTATFSEIFSSININTNSWRVSKTLPTTFSEKIRYLRLERGLTQLQFAKLLNKGFGTITKWEQGITFPKLETIKEISETLEINYTYLLN